MFKSKLRVAGLVVGGGLLIAILLLIVVHTPPARRYALEQLQTRLATQDIKLRAGGISYNLVSGSATLTDVRVSSVRKSDLPPFAEASEVTVEAGVLSLLRGMIHVESGHLDRVVLRWVTSETGRTNLPDIPEKIEKEEGGLPDFLISSLRINHLSVLVDDRQQHLRVELPDAQLRVTGRMPGFNHLVELALSRPGTVRIENRSVPVDELSLRGQLPGNLSGATVDQLLARSGASTVRLAGKVDGLADPRLDFSTDVRLDLTQITKVAQLSEPLGGTARVRATLKGPLGKLIAEGQLQGERMAFRQFREVFANAGFTWDQSQGGLELATFNLRSPFGSAAGKGRLAFDGPSSAELVVHDLDLRRLLLVAGSPVSVASSARGNLRARWQSLNIENSSGEAAVTLTATARHASRNTLPLSGHLSLQLETGSGSEKGSGHATVALEDLRFPGVEASGRVALTSLRDLTTEPKATLGGQINGQVTDLNVLLKNLEAFNGTAEKSNFQELRLRGIAKLSSSVAGTLDRPVFSVKLDAPSLGVGDFDGIRVIADALLTPKEMRVSRADATWKGQSASVEGTVEFAGASPVFDLRSTVTARSLAEILEALGRDMPIRGQGEVVAALQGTAENPRARFSGEVTDIEAYQESLGTLTLKGTLADRIISLEEIALNKPGGPDVPTGSLTASGSYSLDAGAYQVRLASRNLRLSHLNLPGSLPVAGELKISAEGTGTVEDPRLDWNLEVSDLKVQDRPLGGVKAQGLVRDRQADVSLEAQSLNLAGRGRVSLDAPYPAQAEIKADRLDLSKLPFDVGGKPLDGSITATLLAHGNAENPVDGEAKLAVSELSLRFSGQQIENQKPFLVDYANRQVALSSTTLAVGASYVTIAGQLPLAPAGQNLPAPGSGVSVQGIVDLSQMANIFFPSTGYSAAGTLKLDGLVTGDIPNINPTLSVSVQDGTFRAPELAEPIQQIALSVALANGAVAIERLSARLGPGTLDLRGTIPLGILPVSLPASIPQSQGPADVRGTISNLSLQSISGLPEDVTGSLTASLQAQSAGTDLDSVTASVRLDQLNLRVAGLALQQEIPGFLTLQNGQARLERFALVGPETRIEAGGTARVLDPQTLDLRANGRMDLSLLTVFAKDVAAAGASEFQVRLGGTASDVRATGFWTVDKGQLTLRDPALQLTDLGARLELVGNRVVIRRFDGNLNGGSVQLDGEAGFAKGALDSADLRLTGRGVFLELPEGLQTSSNADLRLTTKGGPIDLSGGYKFSKGLTLGL